MKKWSEREDLTSFAQDYEGNTCISLLRGSLEEP